MWHCHPSLWVSSCVATPAHCQPSVFAPAEPSGRQRQQRGADQTSRPSGGRAGARRGAGPPAGAGWEGGLPAQPPAVRPPAGLCCGLQVSVGWGVGVGFSGGMARTKRRSGCSRRTPRHRSAAQKRTAARGGTTGPGMARAWHGAGQCWRRNSGVAVQFVVRIPLLLSSFLFE